MKLIRDYPLGMMITQTTDAIRVDHTPFLIDATRSDILTAHVPRANPVWQGLDGKSVQIVFHGPNAYISPSWYAAKKEHGKVVPTWNYAVVHAHGVARVFEEKAWLRQHLEALTDFHERQFAHPWKVSDAPADYIDKLLSGVVGLEIAVTNLEGKFKLGQNRPPADRQGVLIGLTALGSPLADALQDGSHSSER
jgi:transcriptional regulator